MGLSDRIKTSMAEGSWIRRMLEEGTILKWQHGDENVFDLSLGNPVMEPPPQFHEELRKLANNPQPGMHRYMPNAGYGETRAAVAESFSQVSGVSFSSDDIIMSCGAAGACNVALMTLLNPGDEVIIFVPYFVEYINCIENCGRIPKLLPTDQHFLPKLDAFEAAIGPRGLPDDVKAVSVSQSARDSNRPEPEIVKKLQENGYLLLSEEAFSLLNEEENLSVGICRCEAKIRNLRCRR